MPSLVYADEAMPAFKDYPVQVKEFKRADNFVPNRVSGPGYEKYQKTFAEKVKGPADFAGKYVIVPRDGGMMGDINARHAVTDSFIINLETGQMVDAVLSLFGVSYRLDSSLIIADPNPNPCKKEDEAICQAYNDMHRKARYYVLKDDGLTQLWTEPAIKKGNWF